MTEDESTDRTPEEIFKDAPKPEYIRVGEPMIRSMMKSMRPVNGDDSEHEHT